MNAQEMWRCYSSKANIRSCYHAWAFGDDTDKLAGLVACGIKTATASLQLWYDLKGEPLPNAGEYSIVLDSEENAVCIIRTEKVFVRAFREVDERHAWKEGEGDRSLSYWRETHERYFQKELEDTDRSFDEGIKVVCEEFVKVYP